MKALLNLFHGVGASTPTAIMPSPMEFSSAELHTMSLALNHWANTNPGVVTAKSSAFKIDAIRGAWNRWTRENS